MGRFGFEARMLSASDLAHYDRLAREHGSVFDTVTWTDLYGDSLTRYGIYGAGGDLRGGFCLFREKRLGLTVLMNPPFTPSIGPFFDSRAQNPAMRLNELRDVITVLAESTERQHAAVVSICLSQWVTDCLPFFWRNYKVIPVYTYLLPLDQTEEAILAAMSDKRRGNIRKASKDGLRPELTSNYSTIATLVETTFARQGKAANQDVMKRILFSFARPDNSYAFVVQSGGVPIAGVFVVHDAKTAYYLLSGYDSDSAHGGAGALALFEAIRHAKELGLAAFDFEGSVVPAIETYFRGFGGKLTPCLRVNKAWLPLEMALKLFKRRLF